MPSDVESQVGAGFEAMTSGDWSGAHDAFVAVLAGAEVPEALLGLANACYWLGDLPAMMRSLERAYAAARQRPDPVLAAAAALSLVGYHKQFVGNMAAARGWLARAARIVEAEAPQLRVSCSVGRHSSPATRWKASGWPVRRWPSAGPMGTAIWSCWR